MKLKRLKAYARAIVGIAGGVASFHAIAATQTALVGVLADLSLEQLSNIEVTSVSGRAESLQEAPGSIYVITG